MTYTAPLKDMLFVINHLARLPDVNVLPGFEDATAETVEAVLEENARFCSEVIAPLNAIGDRQPSSWSAGQVTTTPGFKHAYQAFAQAGWQGIHHPIEFGGQGLPKLVATPCIEMLNAGSVAFALCPLLTDGAIEALMTAGSDVQKALYLPPLIAGAWTGTMNLTEPQAGSDLSLIRARAVPQDDGSYKIFGTKIFITYGDHDLAENIIHLVLARTPDAPAGVKGLSLFVVPKICVNPDGTLAAPNDVECVSLEHKLGIKASPTAVLQFGDCGGAIGTLLGAENRGLETMFIMMNAARFAVGMQGIGIAERAYQLAANYAKQRIQSRDLDGSAGAAPIIRQPDVRRMLMTMRAQIEAARALAYVTAATFDIAQHHADLQVRQEQQARYELLVPIVKGWSTELSIEVASLGVQIHGGMGYIEETGAAQHYRDARILTIYEGTTAIQANDLVARKTVRDDGVAIRALLDQVRATVAELAQYGNADSLAIQRHLSAACASLEQVVAYVIDTIKLDIKAVYAGSVPYLKFAGIVLGGWQLARAALIAQKQVDSDPEFCRAKIITARFFAEHFLSQAPAYQSAIIDGAASVMALDDAQF